MKEIVGVRFKSVGKIYYFSPGDIKAQVGDRAIVETVRVVECGEVVIANRQINDEEINSPLKPIIRLADANDLKTVEKNKQREKDAFRICEEKIAFRKL
ncbi:MAG: stage 0 sporulation protein, partial [Ruminococcus sp.]|nr:stage 0 sporulation protein [Ruminococcus sp.]